MGIALRPSLAGTATLALVGAMASGASAQEPSPEPPPWFGGRVEMPEHGFAVTLPDGWVVFDVAADVASQAEAAADVIDPDAWMADLADLADLAELAELPEMAEVADLVFAQHATSATACLIGALISWGLPLDLAAGLSFSFYTGDPALRDVELPQRIDLPAGPSYLTRMSQRSGSDVVTQSSVSEYVLDADGRLFIMLCGTEDTRPDDDWLSIAETIEFLPAE